MFFHRHCRTKGDPRKWFYIFIPLLLLTTFADGHQSRPFRKALATYCAEDRQTLANLISKFLSDGVVEQHSTITHQGRHLLHGHASYISDLEAFLSTNGGERFVPLPYWDPKTTIPPEFAKVKPSESGSDRPPLVNLSPSKPLPNEFIGDTLCRIPDEDTLGNRLDPWHSSVHMAVGGTMANLQTASAALIFWPWHAFVDTVYRNWLKCPSHGELPSPSNSAQH